MTLHVRAKVLLHVWSYDFMTGCFPLNKGDVIMINNVKTTLYQCPKTQSMLRFLSASMKEYVKENGTAIDFRG